MHQSSNIPMSTLRSLSRVPALNAGQAQWVVSLFAGAAAAAATCLLDFKLGVPGHAILRCVLPMALGLTLAPFRGSGMIMSVSALATGTGLKLAGFGEKGIGSIVSLLATGPLLDFAANRARSAKGMWLGLIAAGTLSNVIAFVAQVLAKLMHLETGGGKPLSQWWKMAIWTYPACGAVAGLLTAAVLFRWNMPARTSDV